MRVEDLLARLKNVKQNGSGAVACCPSHEDKRASLSVSEGDDGRILLHCHAGCETPAILAALGLEARDLFSEEGRTRRKSEIVATYDYTDEKDALLYQVVRLNPKDFRQRRPDGAGGWIWKLDGIERVLFRLPRVLAAAKAHGGVLVVEGEKDALRLETLGTVATTSSGGASSWQDRYADALVGARVIVVLPDNDDAGRKYAEAVARSCHSRGLPVRVVKLPGLPVGGDVSDWLDKGGTEAELAKLLKATPRWEPGAVRDEEPVPSDDASAPPEDTEEWDSPVPFGEYDLPSFPVTALPDRLRVFVQAEATATQTPPDLAAMVALATVAASCAKKVDIEVRAGWREPTNIFTVAALDPASRKTPVFRAVTAPLAEFEAEEVRRTRPTIAAAVEKKKVLEERLKRLRGEAADGGASEQGAIDLAQEIAEMVVPAPPHLIVDDSTPEHIAKTLFEQGGRLAIMSPEGGVFDLMAGRYGQGGPNFEVLLKGHAGDDLRVGRVGSGVQYVFAPALTVGLAVQPEVIRGLFDVPGFRGRGLLARFLYSMPKSTLGRRDVTPAPVEVSVLAAYRSDVLELLKLPFATDENGGTVPHILGLSAAASESLMAFASWVEPQLAEGGDLAFMSDWAGKLVGAVARLAGILHMVENAYSKAPWEIKVTHETVEKAIVIGHYLIPHARASFAEMGADPVMAEAKHILGWIEREGVSEFTKRDVHQGTKGRFKTVEKMTPALGLLVAQGYIRERTPERRSGPGRRPSPGFEVNPRSHNSQNSHNYAPPPNSENSENCETGVSFPGPPLTVSDDEDVIAPAQVAL